ncbi:MAG: hypothetical protein J5871_00145 [Bacteroidales bacterium]|nr:hypothetical protein [Bacteroidales bacterium]
MTVFLLTLCIVGLCVVGLGAGLLLRGRDFPQYDVGSNEEMRRRGIRCFKDEDAALHAKPCARPAGEACKTCSFYESGSDCRPA